ncbi:MAG: response regulator [Ignavibacteriales bacterium]|nr:response regulator [Ignavibacteriales bacterium]
MKSQNKNTVTNFPESVLKHLGIEEGLSQSMVNAIAQDSRGFMWFGTSDGLNKYDGYSFTVHTHNPYNSKTISGNSIKGIFEDSQGILWVITTDGDINLMDRKTEVFHKIPIITPNMLSIAEDKEGNIWIGTGGNGLYLIERKNILASNYQYTNYKHNSGIPNSLSGNHVLSIGVDDDGTLWIGTISGLDKFSPDKKIGFEHFVISKVPTNGFNNMIGSILFNDDNTLWLGTIGELILFDKITGKFTAYPHEIGAKINRHDRTSIYNIVKDRFGDLWMIVDGGLLYFNVINKSYNFREPRTPQPAISKLYLDRAGNIWMGTGYGIYVYFPESNRFKSFPDKNHRNKVELVLSIRAIFEDSQNNLWFSSWNSIYKWNRKTNKLTSFGNLWDGAEFGTAGASSITEDKNGNVWFASYAELYSINVISNKQTHFTLDYKSGKAPRGIFVDRSGSIWIVSDRYLSKLIDIQKGYFVDYLYNDKPIDNPKYNSMIYQDEDGIIWFTSNMGLIKFDQISEKFTFYKNDPGNRNSIYSNSTLCICPDPRSPIEKLWIGTAGGGLNLFDKQTETFTHIMEKDGLPNNTVYGILSDVEGNLWLSTNKGLSKYNPVRKQFTNYNINDGLQSNEFNTGAFFKSISGEMFFGGINGFNYFFPNEVANKDSTAKLVFTDLKLFNKSVSVRDDNSILTNAISDTKEITLSYSENIFSVEFALLDYYAPVKNQFVYKLAGFSKNWILLGNKREVTFTGLDPGEYILKVKGTNSDGIWSQGFASLKIKITPPFWATWWAYSFYALFFLSLLYNIRRYELNRTLLKNQHKLDEVKLREREETDKMKSRFFANISHEFRTPLTLILGPSESIIQDSNQEEIKKRANTIKRNANGLLDLINQLLDLSKLEAGKLKLKASESNIVPFIKGITMSFESVAERKDITLKVKSSSDKIELFFDKEKVITIMTNLLSNAFKFTPEGGEITVSVKPSSFLPLVKGELKGDSVEIKVRDTGIGISEEELPKLFDRFYQVDNSQTREHEGTGIGLALTKELVELHKGKISVTINPGAGTEFTIELPTGNKHLKDEEIIEETLILTPIERGKNLVEINETDSSHFDRLSVTKNDGEANEDKNIVLIVEDNTDVREFIKDSLGNEFEIAEAANGEQGIRKAEKIIPDLIISDIAMPVMDGIELSRRLKNDEKTSHIPIILLTAKSGQESKIEGLETGADDYLTKPFATKELQIRIKNLINIRRKLQEKYGSKDFVTPKRGEEKKLSNLEEKFMNKVIEVIEHHLSEEDFSIEQFGKEVGMSRVQLHRKLKALSGKSASNYLRSVRLNKAKQMIEEEKGNISEIAYSVGFSSPQYFTRCFKEEFGYPPSELIA